MARLHFNDAFRVLHRLGESSILCRQIHESPYNRRPQSRNIPIPKRIMHRFPLPPLSLANALALAALFLVTVAVVVSYVQDGLVADLASTELDAEEKLTSVQAAFDAWGPFAPVAYILFVTAEVVIAPLPGLMLYAPGGVPLSLGFCPMFF